MKKILFVITVLLLCGVVMMVTPCDEQSLYDLPSTSGGEKIVVATVALIASIWGAIVEIKKSLLVWAGMVVLMALLSKAGVVDLDGATILASVIMCGIVGVWANNDAEIKNFLLIPFDDENDK